MRRLLPALVCAQALGIALADQGVVGVGAAVVLGGTACAVGIIAPAGRLRALGALVLAFAAGALALAVRLEAAQRQRPLRPEERSVAGRVEALGGGSGALRVDLAQVSAVDGGPGVPRRVRLFVSDPLPVTLLPGVFVRARLRLEAPHALRNPGALERPRHLERAGIGAVARLVDPDLIARVPADDARLRVRLHALRQRLGDRLARSGDGGPLLRALALGDRVGLDRGLRDAFARLGLAHLLAVSGLHLGLVAAGSYAVSRRLLARRARLAARCDTRDAARIVALLGALAYAVLSGFGVPVRRALVLVTAAIVLALRERRTATLQPLAVAASCVLALDPAALFAPGAQLSFAACAALVWGGRTVAGDGADTLGSAGRALRASARAMAVTAPLAALHLGVAAPVGLLANAVAIPWTAFALLPAALLAAAVAPLPESSLGDGALWLAERLAALTMVACEAAGRVAPERLGVAPHPLAIALAGALGWLTLCARGPLLAALLATAGSVVLWAAPPPPLRPAPPRLVVLDVAGGDALLVQGRRAALLVDGGAAREGLFDRGASVVVPALRALGVSRLDLVVATHADVDHRGGLPAVISALPVGALWIPHGSGPDPAFGALQAAAARAGVPIRERGRGSPALALGDLRIEPLWPPPGGGPGPRNEGSLALRVTAERRRVLLLGDLGAAERGLLEAAHLLEAEVLVLPHHGSGGSSSAALLAAVAPQVVVVSAPCPPRRALPHPGALARARRAGASVWWTGRDGAVLVGLGRALRVLPWAPARDCDGAPESGR